jgi:hypothetical protein
MSGTVSTANPVKRRAGLAGARARWGDQPRIVRLDQLTSEQRRLVVALVEAAKSRPDPTPEAA